MLTFLGNILAAMENFPSLIWAGMVDLWDALMSAIHGFAVAIIAVLPGMPSAPSFADATWLHWLNWIYPVGDLLAGVTALLTLWAGFMAARYVLKVLGVL